MKQIQFTIPGEPKGKGRPRFSRNGHTYTPKDTASYENLVKLEYERRCKNIFDSGIPLELRIEAYFAIPKSASKKKRADMLAGVIRPTKKPDMDNIIKIIADSLNGIAYRDDAQIVSAKVYKYYSDMPRVEVGIREMEF